MEHSEDTSLNFNTLPFFMISYNLSEIDFNTSVSSRKGLEIEMIHFHTFYTVIGVNFFPIPKIEK